MRDNAIYFPYIKVPKSTWFNQILLYWNKVYSIIPDGTDKYYTDSYRRKLIQNDLVMAADPDYYFNQNISYNSFKPFIDYLLNPDYLVKLHQNYPKTRLGAEFMCIRKTKFHYEILPELLDTGLFKPLDNDWIAVESNTAKQYMLFLAGLLSKLPQFNATAITDTSMELEHFKPSHLNNHLRTQMDVSNPLEEETREILLNNILPAPAKIVGPDEITKFKERYFDELIQFRRGLEKEIIDIANISNPVSREERRIIVEEEAKSEIEEISEKMRQNGWTNIIKNNWKSIGVTMAGIGLTAATVGAPPATLTTAIGLALSIKKIYDDKIKVDKSILNDNFYAYALLTKKEFESIH